METTRGIVTIPNQRTIKFSSKNSKFADPDNFEESRTDGEDCDVKFEFNEGRVIYGHKIILKSRSQYFKNLFQPDVCLTPFRELASQDLHAVNAAITFLYTGHVNLRLDVQDLVRFFEVTKLFHLEDFTESSIVGELLLQLSGETCLLLRSLADRLEFNDLHDLIQDWIKNNFLDISSKEQFVNLEFDEVSDLVTNASRKLAREEEILDAILRWVENRKADRTQHLFSLVRKLDLGTMLQESPDFLLDKFQPQASLYEDLESSKLLTRIILQQTVQELRSKDSRIVQDSGPSTSTQIADEDNSCSVNQKRSRPRTGKNRLGFAAESSLKRTRRSKRLPSYSESESDSEVAVVLENSDAEMEDLEENANKPLFLYPRLEKRGRSALKKILESFDFETNTRGLSFTCKERRQLSSLLRVGDKLYDIGGNKVNEGTLGTEVFTVGQDKGLQGPNLWNQAYEGAACQIGNYVYMVGGCELLGLEGSASHNCLQRLCLSASARDMTWEKMNFLSQSRGAHDIAVLNGHIYAVGGIGAMGKRSKKIFTLKSVDVYDPNTNEWALLPEESFLNTPRAFFQLCRMEDKLYAVGGSGENRQGILDSVEAYNPETKRWTFLPYAMKQPRSSAGAFTSNQKVLYAIGGNDGPVPTLEVYDSRTNEGWNLLPWPTELSINGEFISGISF